MKKSIAKLFGILAISGVVLTSCSSSDDDEPTSSFQLVPSNFKGDINDGQVILNASTVYTLTGRLVVNEGAELVIPAGTVIEATGGTSSYIAVAQGGKISINGTSTNPVVMTASQKEPGAWGGLVVCGKAPINKGETATAEVSVLTYGGNVANDNSGVIRYLRVEYSGAAFNSEKEFNGVSFFGVGSGTTVEYVQVHEGSDDGFEFFGGTVNTKYLVSTSNEDDQFDWTEGWSGTNENWFGKLGLGRGNRGIEADNNSSNHVATPISNPSIKNLTLIGLGDQGTESQAIKLRVGTKAVFDNVVLNNFLIGFDVQHDESISYIADGTLKATNVKFDNIITLKAKYNPASLTEIYAENSSATGAGNGTSVPAWAQGWTVGL